MAKLNLAYDFNTNDSRYARQNKSNIHVLKKKKDKYRKLYASKLSLIATTLGVFSMLIILSYRYNIISEKNLTIQRLDITNTETLALLTSSELELNSLVDYTEVEAYAKQQLGMQEPSKSQIKYLASNFDSTNSTNSVSENAFTKALNYIKQRINEIF